MTRKKVVELTEEEKQVAIARIEAVQQRFVELLLAGKSIAEAARVVQIGRRTATYWMSENSFVRFAYESERQKAATQFRERITKLHDLTLSALEDALAAEADPDVRISVAKFLYSSNLAQFATLAPLADADRLVETVLSAAETDTLLMKNDEVRLYYVKDD